MSSYSRNSKTLTPRFYTSQYKYIYYYYITVFKLGRVLIRKCNFLIMCEIKLNRRLKRANYQIRFVNILPPCFLYSGIIQSAPNECGVNGFS